MPTRYTLQAFQADYPDDATCLAAILARRVGPKPICPACHRQTRYFRLRKRRAYSCQWCGAHVYPCVGTPFEKSRTPLTKWFTAMYLFTTTRHGVAAKELERQLGVTYQVRLAHGPRDPHDDGGPRRGVASAAPWKWTRPTSAGSAGARAAGARRGRPRCSASRPARAPSGPTWCPDTARATLEPIVAATVAPGAVVHTDEWTAYRRLAALGYRHRTVTHGRGQWADRGSHTNTLEGLLVPDQAEHPGDPRGGLPRSTSRSIWRSSRSGGIAATRPISCLRSCWISCCQRRIPWHHPLKQRPEGGASAGGRAGRLVARHGPPRCALSFGVS